MKKSVGLLVLLAVVILTPSSAFAQLVGGSGAQSIGSVLIPFLPIFVLAYLLLFRPQQKRAKVHRALLNALKKDDSVITSGGIYATVSAIRGNIIEVKVAG
ncbi:preprotein translocase subunit YajC [Endomicrobiia bacterium]|nr:preprotein translocase subunit YajC [Endomicrobiia bacterium]